jgi:hypothetical protein
MDMMGNHMVEGMCMVEEHSSKERLKVEGIDTEEERPSKERAEMESIDTKEEHPSKERPEVDSTDMEGMNMVEGITVEVVEREHESMVLKRHWIGDGAENHR